MPGTSAGSPLLIFIGSPVFAGKPDTPPRFEQTMRTVNQCTSQGMDVALMWNISLQDFALHDLSKEILFSADPALRAKVLAPASPAAVLRLCGLTSICRLPPIPMDRQPSKQRRALSCRTFASPPPPKRTNPKNPRSRNSLSMPKRRNPKISSGYLRAAVHTLAAIPRICIIHLHLRALRFVQLFCLVFGLLLETTVSRR